MDLILPGFGLLFWQTVIFVLVLIILGRFAWKPIMKALNERERVIEDALSAAEKAKEEMKKLQADNEALLQQARQERDKILKDAQSSANHIISEARDKATEEANRIIESARALIITEKNAALAEVKNTASALSLEIAEKLLKYNLSNDESQKRLVQEYLKESKLN
ncbi:MAG: F0F1 ATP synthase subunit B [Cytophagaceae bacterium]|nr:F0F1 ATP synthase subunit B [Cytophagaceae bacterium]MDW8457193.1 F0F1 ATP synthase subunit B [Cytophagaceae bacterium]